MKIIAAILIVVLVSFTAYTIVGHQRDKWADTAALANNQRQKTSVDDVAQKTASARTVIVSEAGQSSSENVDLDEAGDPVIDDGPIVSEELEERYRALSENDQYPTLSSRMAGMNARRPDSSYAPEDILSAMEKSAAWESKDDPGILSQKLSSEELNDGRQFLDFDQLKVETLMPGDHMDIAVDSIGRVFDMRVDGVKVFDDGNVMWKGTIVNDEGGTVSITQSSTITVASVILTEDDYTLESHGGDGWIVDSSVLFKIDPHKTDAIIPPTDH